MDPAFIDSAGDVQFLLQLYAGLTRLDEDGKPYASLAESWSLSADGRTYTFRLRSGLTFSDGSPLDATDVRRSWLRILDPATASTAPDVLSLIQGADERLAGGPEDGVAVDAPDARTLVVTLEHAAAYFTAVIATPTAFVVPRGARGSDDSWQSMDAFIGSGPYVADGTDGTDLILHANDRYVAGAPPIAEIRWTTDLPGDGVTAYADDEVDLVSVGSNDAAWIAYDRTWGRRCIGRPRWGCSTSASTRPGRRSTTRASGAPSRSRSIGRGWSRTRRGGAAPRPRAWSRRPSGPTASRTTRRPIWPRRGGSSTRRATGIGRGSARSR